MGVKRNLDSAGMSDANDNITEDEAALYDRQIRLWGVDCQKRIRETKVLMIGLNGIGAEVVKNLALSGVKSITIMDETLVKPTDYSAQFFVVGSEGQSRAEASKTAIQELNPNVKVTIDKDSLNSKNARFFAEFEAVIATDCPLNILIRVNKVCRENSVHFYCAETWGLYGYCFFDLQHYSYNSSGTVPIDLKSSKKSKAERPLIQRLEYGPLGTVLGAKIGDRLNKKVNKVFILMHIMNNYREMHNQYPSPESRDNSLAELKIIRSKVTKSLGYDETKISDDMLSAVFGELSAVCAVVGGILANEIVRAISRKGLPVHNFFLFNGEEFVGSVESVSGNE